MIPERYMVTGKMTKHKGTLTGYFGVDNQGDYVITSPSGVEQRLVDPDTVEPVAVKVIAKNTGHFHCPNCDAAFLTRTENGVIHNTTPYCGNCGQRLEWGDNNAR